MDDFIFLLSSMTWVIPVAGFICTVFGLDVIVSNLQRRECSVKKIIWGCILAFVGSTITYRYVSDIFLDQYL